MAYTEVWDETKPAGSRAINLGDDDIREMKRCLRERFAAGGMHFPSTDDSNAGKFNYVKYIEQSGNPTSEANHGFTFCKDVSGVTELYWMDSAGTVVQLTTGGKILASGLAVGSDALGDILARGASTYGRVAGNITTTRKFLRQVGTGAASALPEWDTLQEGDIDTLDLPDGAFVQFVRSEYTTQTAISSVVAHDNSKPQISEGTQILSRTITPKATTDLLLIEIDLNVDVGNSNFAVASLYKNSDANPLISRAVMSYGGGSGPLRFSYSAAAGTTSELTFTVRIGVNAGSVGMNGHDGSSAYYGGACISSINITEIKA